MKFLENSHAEAALYYLYMMSDGEVSPGEKKMFNTICKELCINDDDKKEIIDECTKLAREYTDILGAIVDKVINENGEVMWKDNSEGTSIFKVFGNLFTQGYVYKAKVLWNLVNLGYADKVYSEPEQRIVRYLIDKWFDDRSVGMEIYQEFLDTADTILALTKQKEWIKQTFSDTNDEKKKEREISNEIKQLLSDVELSIEELTM